MSGRVNFTLSVQGTRFMPQGTIKKLVSDKGFGFISPSSGGPDIFFHVSSVQGSTQYDNLYEGQAVSYEVEDGGGRGKGPRASSVRAE